MMVRCAMLGFWVAACGRIDFADRDGGAMLGDAPTCAYGPFGTPTPLDAVNSASTEWAADLSPNGLELFFSSDRAGGRGGFDLYRATRASTADAFGQIANVAELNTSGDEYGPALTHDALTLYFSSTMASSDDTLDIFVATRPAIGDAFGAASPVTELNSSANDDTPAITADGLTMVLRSDRAGGLGSDDLYLATRATTADPFTVTDLRAVNSTASDRGATISADGLTVMLGSERTPDVGGYDLFISTRAARADNFSVPVAVPALETNNNDDDADLSEDGSTVLYSTDRSGSTDIWTATRSCM